MRTRPMKRYARADFPTRSEIDADPALLRLLPERWRRNALVLAAVTSACALLAECRFQGAAHAQIAGGIKAPAPQRVSHIAPLFPYPNERATVKGKVAMPHFLTEDEARHIILEEARKEKIVFEKDKLTLKKVTLPNTSDPALKPAKKPVTTLTLDGSETKRNISFEFISAEDYRTLKADPKSSETRLAYGEMPRVADAVRTGLVNANPEGAFAILYDPCLHDEKAAKEKLRGQVREFIKWLKAEGVI